MVLNCFLLEEVEGDDFGVLLKFLELLIELLGQLFDLLLVLLNRHHPFLLLRLFVSVLLILCLGLLLLDLRAITEFLG